MVFYLKKVFHSDFDSMITNLETSFAPLKVVQRIHPYLFKIT